MKILNNNGEVTVYYNKNRFLFDLSYDGIDLFAYDMPSIELIGIDCIENKNEMNG